MFEKLMDDFKIKLLKEKREKIIEELKLMIIVLKKVCDDNNIVYQEIKSREIIVLENPSCSEDDYLEALFVYVELLKVYLGSYFNSRINE